MQGRNNEPGFSGDQINSDGGLLLLREPYSNLNIFPSTLKQELFSI
jgi:hypothetical protein